MSILITCLPDNILILWGEVTYWSLLAVKALILHFVSFKPFHGISLSYLLVLFILSYKNSVFVSFSLEDLKMKTRQA